MFSEGFLKVVRRFSEGLKTLMVFRCLMLTLRRQPDGFSMVFRWFCARASPNLPKVFRRFSEGVLKVFRRFSEGFPKVEGPQGRPICSQLLALGKATGHLLLWVLLSWPKGSRQRVMVNYNNFNCYAH